MENNSSNEGKRKKRKKVETNPLSMHNIEECSDFAEDDSTTGLYYLNVEFIEKLKKDLFSRLI